METITWIISLGDLIFRIEETDQTLKEQLYWAREICYKGGSFSLEMKP